jgi:hypothetical protein
MARFNNGWVKIHRKAILGDIYSNFTRGGLFTVLVGIANMQGSTVSWRGKPRKLERGEIVTSITELSQLGETDRRTIDRHLAYLIQRGTITTEKCSSGTIIKILNFDLYQSVDADGAKRQRNDTSNDRLNDSAHIEERKKRRKKESDSHPLWPLYKQFVDQYPVKVSLSAKGFERFLEHVSNETDFSKVLLHLAYYKKHLQRNPWKAAKQSVETWFGTDKSGYFWLQWDTESAGESKLKVVGMSDIVDR